MIVPVLDWTGTDGTDEILLCVELDDASKVVVGGAAGVSKGGPGTGDGLGGAATVSEIDVDGWSNVVVALLVDGKVSVAVDALEDEASGTVDALDVEGLSGSVDALDEEEASGAEDALDVEGLSGPVDVFDEVSGAVGALDVEEMSESELLEDVSELAAELLELCEVEGKGTNVAGSVTVADVVGTPTGDSVEFRDMNVRPVRILSAIILSGSAIRRKAQRTLQALLSAMATFAQGSTSASIKRSW